MLREEVVVGVLLRTDVDENSLREETLGLGATLGTGAAARLGLGVAAKLALAHRN